MDGCVLTLNGVATVPIVSHIADSLPSKLTLDPLRVGQVRVPGSTPSQRLAARSGLGLGSPISCQLYGSRRGRVCGMAQIVSNGLSNAAKLTKKGKVELVVQVKEDKFWIEVCGRHRPM